MPRGFQQNKRAVLKILFEVSSDARGGDSVRIALQNERRSLDVGQVSAVVRKKCELRKMLCDHRVGAAKTVCQFFGEFGAIGVVHNDWCKSVGPTEIVAVEGFEEAVDVDRTEVQAIPPRQRALVREVEEAALPGSSS